MRKGLFGLHYKHESALYKYVQLCLLDLHLLNRLLPGRHKELK